MQHLQKLRTELKAHIKNIQQDTGKLAASVAKERETSTKMITDLARSITMLKNTPMGVHAKEDPWFTNSLVARQLQKQVHEENALQKSIIIMQQNSEHFEEGVVRAIQMAWQTFDEWKCVLCSPLSLAPFCSRLADLTRQRLARSARASSSVQETWQTMGELMRSVAPTTEWIAFASRSEYLLDPETPLRNPLTINYPGKDDPSVIPVHQGILERKKRYTKTYKESFYILTPAGYLHEYPSSDLSKHPNPELSLFLPECTLGAPTNPQSRSHKFHIEGKKSIGGDVGQKSGLFALDASFTFRARSHDEMLEWWNDCKQLSKVYLTASEPFDRSGPVPAAVRAAGYISEDEDEYETDEGSSVEEMSDGEYEDDEEEDEEHNHRAHGHNHQHHHHAQESAHHHHQQQQQHEQARPSTTYASAGSAPALGAPVRSSGAEDTSEAPAYSAPAAGSGIQTGAGGYAVEKKAAGGAGGPAGGAGPSGHHAADSSEEDETDEGDESGDEEDEDEEEGQVGGAAADAQTAAQDKPTPSGGPKEATVDGEDKPAIGHFVEQLGGNAEAKKE